MTETSASHYRRPSKDRLAQGDIGFAEIVQVRSASGSERPGPGPEDLADGDVPFLGPFSDHELVVPRPGGGEERRILRVWSCLAIVLTQNCELDWANPADSRLQIAPVVTQARWPEGPWKHLRRAPPPGYMYLPPLEGDAARELGLKESLGEAVALLASTSNSTARIIKPRRVIGLTTRGVVGLQDALARFYSVRGFADFPALRSAVGKPIADIQETGQLIQGPSQLVKVFLGDGADPDADDEVSVSYWGVRPTAATRETNS